MTDPRELVERVRELTEPDDQGPERDLEPDDPG